LQEIELIVTDEDVFLINEFLKRQDRVFREFKEVKKSGLALIWEPIHVFQRGYVSRVFSIFAGKSYTCQERRYGFVMSKRFASRWKDLNPNDRARTICHEFYHQYYQGQGSQVLYFLSYYIWFAIRPWTWMNTKHYYKFCHPFEAAGHEGAFIVDDLFEKYLT
jgi:hypothetical protein